MIPQGVGPELIDALNRASSLVLFQLSTVIERLLADPRRIVQVLVNIYLGQTARFRDWRDGQMRTGKVVALKDTQVTLHEDGSRPEWKLPYAAIKPPPASPKPAETPAPQPQRPTRNGFRCGEQVAFEDRSLQTQVGTIVPIIDRTATIDPGDGTKWRVGFALLRHVLDV